jgi:hypothetical protein
MSPQKIAEKVAKLKKLFQEDAEANVSMEFSGPELKEIKKKYPTLHEAIEDVTEKAEALGSAQDEADWALDVMGLAAENIFLLDELDKYRPGEDDDDDEEPEVIEAEVVGRKDGE